jgi:hypothetical protein
MESETDDTEEMYGRFSDLGICQPHGRHQCGNEARAPRDLDFNRRGAFAGRQRREGQMIFGRGQ